MSQLFYLTLLLAILYIGDIVSTRTKGWVPSVFVCAVLFLLGYWTIFPQDVVAQAGISNGVAVMLMYLLVTNMGTMLSLDEFIKQWKTVLISLAGILGVAVFILLIIPFVFDKNTAVIAIPPLVGGVVSSIIMSEKATQLGLVDLSVFAIIIYVMQGFVGYPLTSIMLKKEANKVLKLYRNNQWHEASQKIALKEIDESTPTLFVKFVPEKYNTFYFKLFRLTVVATAAYYTTVLIKPVIDVSPFVLCLLYGVIATRLGFLEKHPLMKANSFGFAVMGLMLFIFNMLNRATPQMLLDLIYPLLAVIVIATIGMYLFSFIMGKILGVSKEMAFAISLTSMYGFPADYIITQEVINMMTHDEKEREVLLSHMLAPMLIGGFISVTIVSVVLAGILVNYITV